MEWFTTNSQTVSRDVGLAGGSVDTFYPFMGFLLCAGYFITNRRTIIGDYYQGEEEYEKIHDVRVIAQLGLRFFTSTSTVIGVYNETTPEEKNQREQQFIQFIRTAKASSPGMHMKTELVSLTSSKSSTETPTQDQTVHNTDCKDNFTNSSWWKAKYSFNSICEDEEPVTRYLPISFLLEGTEASGGRVRLYGAVKSLIIESDRDVSTVIPADSIAWKMQMELVDCNWKQKGGEPGSNKVFSFVCTQQNDKCVFSTLVGSDGRPYNIFVSQFKLRLHKDPVNITDSSILSQFLADDTQSSLAELSIHPSRDLLLSYMIRSLPLIDTTITHTKDDEKKMLLLGGASSTTQLPLEVHIRSPQALTGDNDKFVAYPVLRIMVRYVTTPPEPGNMQPDAVAIKSVQMMLPEGRILAQDITDKKKWVIDDTVLHRDTTVDLLMLNKTPVEGGKGRTPGMTGGAKNPEEEGVVSFTSFPGVRQGFTEISVNKLWQDKLRGTSAPNQSWDDLRVNAASDDSIDIAAVFGDTKEKALVFGAVVALLLGWKYGTNNSVEAIGMASTAMSSIIVLFVFALAIAEYLERLPENLRPYEPILYIGTCIALLLSVMTVIYTSRFIPETSSGVYLSVLIAVLAAVMILAMETKSPIPMAPSAQSFKIGILIVLAMSLYVLASETNKIYQKAKIGFNIQPLNTTIGNLPNPAALLTLAVVVALVGAITVAVAPSDPDSCDPLFFERNRIDSQIRRNEEQQDEKQAQAMGYFTERKKVNESEINACLAAQKFPFSRLSIFHNERLSNFIPIFIAAVPLIINLTMPMNGKLIGAFSPSRLAEETFAPSKENLAIRRVEDGRIPRGLWAMKTFAGLALTGLILYLLAPNTEISPGKCSILREREMDNRDVVRKQPLVYDSEKQMSQIYQGEWRYDCVPKEKLVTYLVTGGIVTVAILSFLTPARKRFIPTNASAISVLTKLVYFVAVSSIMIWAYNDENRVKILNL